MIQVLVVDDQEIIRTGLVTIINSHPELEVCGQAGDGFVALKMLDEVAVDVVLLDLRMPGIDGVETIRRIRKKYPNDQCRVLVLTTFEQDDNVVSALHAGADGFLGKGAGPVEILDGILGVAAGSHALSETAVVAVVGHVANQRQMPGEPEMRMRFALLTEREAEIVEALVAGLDAQSIADTFVLSPYTVKTHTNRAMTKVGARDRGQLVSFAVRAGIIPDINRFTHG